ncbi:hypothetical protein [Hydrogenimonas sp.]
MQKREVVRSIEEAMASLDAQLKYMGYLMAGVDLKEEVLVTHISECGFDLWIEGNRRWIVKLFGKATLEDLSRLHLMRLNENKKICDIIQVCSSRKKGIVGRFFGRKRASTADLDRAKAYYDDLKKINDKLVRKMEILLIRAKSRPAEDYLGVMPEPKEERWQKSTVSI